MFCFPICAPVLSRAKRKMFLSFGGPLPNPLLVRSLPLKPIPDQRGCEKVDKPCSTLRNLRQTITFQPLWLRRADIKTDQNSSVCAVIVIFVRGHSESQWSDFNRAALTVWHFSPRILDRCFGDKIQTFPDYNLFIRVTETIQSWTKIDRR